MKIHGAGTFRILWSVVPHTADAYHERLSANHEWLPRWEPTAPCADALNACLLWVGGLRGVENELLAALIDRGGPRQHGRTGNAEVVHYALDGTGEAGSVIGLRYWLSRPHAVPSGLIGVTDRGVGESEDATVGRGGPPTGWPAPSTTPPPPPSSPPQPSGKDLVDDTCAKKPSPSSPETDHAQGPVAQRHRLANRRRRHRDHACTAQGVIGPVLGRHR